MMRESVFASEVKAEPIEWLYRRHIPKGMITIVAGRPDQGKGLFASHIAADITQRGGNVLFSAAEDDHARMTKPRLEAAGADLDRVLLWGFRLPIQEKELTDKIVSQDIDLVIMDPFASHLSGGISRHADNVRQVTDPMKELASELGVTFLIVEHALKRVSSNSEPIAMIGGSGSGLSAAARAAYLFGKDPKDSDRRLLCPAKLNVAEWPPSLAFDVDNKETGEIESVPFLLYQGESEVQAGLIMQSDNRNVVPGRPPDKRAEACEWLTSYLFRRQPVKGGDVVRDAGMDGLTTKTLRRAADDMGVVKKPPGGGKNCTWELPAEVTKALQKATAKQVKKAQKGGK